jgi:very-short-patch-repair endonuclease
MSNIKHKKEFSIYRFQFWMQRGFSEVEAKHKVSEIQKINAKKHVAKIRPEYSIFNKQYWIVKKGMSEEDAVKKVSEIQSKLSPKSSKFKGKVRTTESKIKISNSMKKKIESVGAGEWASHFGSFNGSSKIERELFDYIKENINVNVKANFPIENYIVDIIHDKKIVEFYGDFWHANPRYFKSDDEIKSFSINKTSEEIWTYDKQRIDFLESIGYSVLIIWESDWKKNKSECISLIKKYYENGN